MEYNAEESDQNMDVQVQHDTAAIQLLIENQADFKRFLRRRLPSEAATEDILQQSLLKAIRHPDELAEKDNLTAWFYRILRNSLIDFYRSKGAELRKHDAILQNVHDAGETNHAAVDEELMGEVCACLGRLLPTLKPEYAEVVKRIDLEGESPATFAESSGITYNNLMVRLHRARLALRKSLEKSCGACTKHGCLDCTCGHGKDPASVH